MSSDWPVVRLSEVCDSIVDCVNKTAPVVDYVTPYLMIRTTNVKKGVISLKGARYVTEETFNKWTRRVTPKFGDVVLTREAPLGDVGMITTPEKKIFLGQRLMQYRVNKEKLDPFFLLYALQGSDLQGQLKAAGSGSTVEHIRVGDAENLKIKLPDLCVQKNIGIILSNYDKLIENNNRRITILEGMVQSLYREWFVKFRFPDHENVKFKDSQLGQVPDGWEEKIATDVIEFAPKMSLPKEGDKPFVAMPSISTSSMVIGDIEMRAGNSGTKFKNGDTLMARITPCLQNGKIAFVQHLDEENPIGFGSTEFIVMRSKGLTPEFVYCLARSDSFRGNAINSMAGADGRQRVKNDCFKSYYLAVPPKGILDQFSALAEPAFKEIFTLSQKNKNIRKQRDMILPKLLSGSIEL